MDNTTNEAALDKAMERLTGKSRSELETVVGATVGLRTPQKRAMYQVAMAMLGRGAIPSHPVTEVQPYHSTTCVGCNAITSRPRDGLCRACMAGLRVSGLEPTNPGKDE